MSGDIKNEKMKNPGVFTGELRSDISIIEGGPDENGHPTWVLFDPVSDRYYRIGEIDHSILSYMVGNQDINDFIAKLHTAGVNIEKKEVLKLISFLSSSSLLKSPLGHAEKISLKARETRKKMFWQIFLSSYLFFRQPLFSPDNFLKKTLNVVQLIFNRWTLILVVSLSSIGYLGTLAKIEKLADIFISSISVQGLIRYSVAIFFIKIAHELSHAYVARSFGCRVRKMGIAFVVFLPRLYTDTTDSWRIADRKKRFLIDGAGIICELLLGGLAALFWLNSTPGIANTVAYYIFAVSIINTILINGNPLIRFDGYYMLMDMTNIDNLQKRGLDLVRSFWRTHLFGIQSDPDPAKGWRRIFLVIYGISSFIYRIFLYTSIILIVYISFVKALGIILLVLEVYTIVIKPFYGEIKFLLLNTGRVRTNRVFISLSGMAALMILVFFPFPWKISAPCEIVPQKSAVVYAPTAAYLTQLIPKDGEYMSMQDLVMVQDTPFLDWRLKKAKIDMDANLAKLEQAEAEKSSLEQVSLLRQMIAANEEDISELERQKANLTYKSPIAGNFILLNRHLKNGKWLNKGDIIGEIYSPENPIAVAYIEEKDMRFIRTDYRVRVYVGDAIKSFRGKITRLNPMAAYLQPSPLLQPFGGAIPVYKKEEASYAPVNNSYRVEIEFKGEAPEIGRSGVAKLTRFSSMAGNLTRKVITLFQRELSF